GNSRPVRVGKLSQKQRKMAALSPRDSADTERSDKADTAETRSFRGWSVPASPDSVPSLRDVMRQEQSDNNNDNHNNEATPPPPPPPTTTAWSRGDNGRINPHLAPHEEELRAERALISTRDKPLELIQLEERALQELLSLYALRFPRDSIHAARAETPLTWSPPQWHSH
ncbi:unnamed protein product, partial [Lampetra planeri]